MTEDTHALAAESCLNHDLRSEDDANSEGLSVEEAFGAAVAMDTVSAEAMDAVMGVSPPAVYRRYQARGATAKARNKSNIYGICIHTPEGYESGTLSVLSGLRAGFDAYLPLDGRFYPCNDIGRYFTWHSGHSWGNPMTIGIEQGDFAAKSGQFGDAHYQRLARLCAYYCEIYDLRVEHVQGAKPGLMSHASLTPGARTDPGPSFRWDDLIDMISDHIRGSAPSPTKPAPEPADPAPSPGAKTIYRVKLDADAKPGRQLFASETEAGARAEAERLLKVNGLKARLEQGAE